MKKQLILLFFVFALALLVKVNNVIAAPPANFQTTQVIGSGLSSPTGLDFAPDGRIFILERTGNVRIYKNGQLLTTPFASLPSSINGDKGLIGITFDPDFTNNHFVYFYHTSSENEHGRLVRFDASGDIGTNSTVLYDTNEGILEFHAGGALNFGPDGKLYLSIGDNGVSSNAQSLTNPFGKIHRFNKDGTIPSDNPFFNTSGAVKSIWAYGLRNPYRAQFDSLTGKFYAGDVGNATWEEIDRIEKGANYGWPTCEGTCSNPGFTNPIYTYNHNGGSAAIGLGPVYRANMFPNEYKGSLFFGDYALGFIKRIVLDANGNSTGVFDFDLSAGSVVDLKTASDGSIYYVTFFPGRLYKISYTPSNPAPIVNASADVTTGNPPLTVHFSSSGTTDPNNDPLTYNWDFGDGTTSTQANPTKIYQNKGTFTVQLTVSDGTSSPQSTPIVIQVGTPPTLTITSPTEGQTYKAGDVINYSASAVDSDGATLPLSAFTVEILLHHQTHTHPFFGPVSGNNQGQFTIPTTGESSAETWYEIIISAKDANNLQAKKSVNIFPIKSNFTLNTNPSSLQLTLDGTIINTPVTVQGVVGFKREIAALPLVQTLNNVDYQFHNWSDGGALKHTFITQETDTTYTAVYSQMAPFSAQYFDNQNLVSPPKLTRNDKSINFNWGLSSPDSSIPSDHFSARWTKTQYFATGTYKFTTAADDGVRLYIDGNLLIDKWVDQAETVYTKSIDLTSGDHIIKMEYYENGGAAVAKLSWDIDQAAAPPTGGTNIALNGTAYRWSQNASSTANTNRVAAPGINDNNLTTDVDLNNAVDDNANAWEAAGVTWSTPQSTITSVKFKNGSWDSHLNGAFTANFKLQYSPDGSTWTDSNWLFSPSYAYDSPSVSGVVYTFTGSLSSVMGMRVTGQVRTAGALSWIAHAIEVQAFTTDSSPPPPPPPPPPSGSYLAQYFDNQTLSTPPKVTKNETAINFDWGSGSPDPQIPSDHFSAIFTKTATFENADYEFTTTADDGVRLYVDNQIILDKWIDQSPTIYKVTKSLTSGDHTIKLEYYENTGGAVAKMSYLKVDPSLAFTGQYFDNQTLSGSPKITRLDPVINFDWGNGSPDPQIPTDHFSARWTKQQNFTAGNYSFTLKSDDGIRFWVDNQIVVDDWTNHAVRTYNPGVNITAGIHTIKIEYYENGGKAVAIFTQN